MLGRLAHPGHRVASHIHESEQNTNEGLFLKSLFRSILGMFWLVPVIEGGGGEGVGSTPAHKCLECYRRLPHPRLSFLVSGVTVYVCSHGE